MQLETVETPETAQVEAQALAWPERAGSLAVVDGPSYNQAAQWLLGIKDLRKEIEDTFGPIIRAAHAAHREAVAQRKKVEAPLEEAERTLKRGLAAYDTEQERLRRDEERRLQEEARQRDEARRLDEAAQLEAEALATDDPGKLLEANDLIEQPAPAPMPVFVPKATPTIAGVSYRERWGGEITDLKALVAYVAAHPQYLHLLTPNLTAINQLARSLKGQLQIPGLRAVCTKDVAAGRRS